MSLLPNRTVPQKDILRTSSFLAGGSCHLGAHLELLKATQPSVALTVRSLRQENSQNHVSAFLLGQGRRIKSNKY